MEEEPTNIELYDRFKDELKRPLSERYYAEEELIAIFDIAGDRYDDYVRSEVLLLGMRLYPDSEALLGRRAIYYRDREGDSYDRFMADYEATPSSIMEILKLSATPGDGDQAVRVLDEFLATHDLREDEEAIRFVQIAHEMYADKWLIDNLDRVRAKVDYLPSLLYEIAMLSNESDEFAKVAPALLEELTELEPYSPEYWTLLALVYLRDNRLDDARTAVDYALAIDPAYPEALKAKIRTYADSTSDPEIGRLVDRLYKTDPADPELALIELTRLEQEGYEPAKAFIDKLPREAFASQAMVAKAILYGYDDMARVFNDFYDAGFVDEDMWRSLAELAFNRINIKALTTLYEVFENRFTRHLDHQFIDLRMLYRMHQYDDAINLFVNADTDSELRNPHNMLECYVIYIMSLLRVGREGEALQAIEAMQQAIESSDDVPLNPIEQYGLVNFFEKVIKKVNRSAKPNWAKFDPLGLDFD